MAKRIWLCGTILVVGGIVTFMNTKHRPVSPAPLEHNAVVEVVVNTAPPEPALLATVIDVTDIDKLLDPPALPIIEAAQARPILTAVGYEQIELKGIRTDHVVPAIPRSIDEE